MRLFLKYLTICLLTATSLLLTTFELKAQDQLEISTGADLMSRYVWRGIDIGSNPSIQPTLALDYSGFELGVWGAYAISSNVSGNDEIDTWLSYSHNISTDVSVTAILTDYYFPNAGVKWGNFNDYDDPDGGGAHLLEAGIGLTGPESFPISFFGYMNIYNDAGNNTYFQLNYATAVKETSLDLFVGATGGSEDNPDYYGSSELNIINIGVTANRDIKISEDFSLPISVSFIMNPRVEMTYLLFGLSL